MTAKGVPSSPSQHKKSAEAECLPPMKLRVGFASMLKATTSNNKGGEGGGGAYFDRNKREHVEFACNMYLDSLQNSFADLVNDDDRSDVASQLVKWAMANPDAPTFSEYDQNKKHFFPSLLLKKRKSKKKPTKIGTVIQHVNKAKVPMPPEPVNTTTGGDIEVTKAASLPLLNSTVSSITDYTYSTFATLEGNSTASLSFDKSKSVERQNNGRNFSYQKDLSVILEGPMSYSGAIVNENGVEISPASAKRLQEVMNKSAASHAENDPYLLATPRVRN